MGLGFPGGSVLKNLPASAGDAGEVGSPLSWEHRLEEELATCFSTLAWKTPWTQETGRIVHSVAKSQ